ncbi:UDP-N-acetylmuramate dehydrogenase [Vibrio splendidus]
MIKLTKDNVRDLKEVYGNRVAFNVSLSSISYWKIGGNCEAVVYPNSEGELISIIRFCKSKSIPFVVVGNTSNLLFSDAGLHGILIKIGENYAKLDVKNNVLTAQSGVWAPFLARKAMQEGFSGVEHICGIPGTIGGLVYMNGGSQRKTISEAVLEVLTVDENGKFHRYDKTECDFSYRHSIFQGKKEIILKVSLRLEIEKNKSDIRTEMLSTMRARRRKFPNKLPNCGSVFISDPDMFDVYGPPGKIIEDCGLKGLKQNNAQISTMHANFIVNNGGAKAKDVLYLINKVRDTVYERTGYLLKVEAKYISSFGEVSDIEDL